MITKAHHSNTIILIMDQFNASVKTPKQVLEDKDEVRILSFLHINEFCTQDRLLPPWKKPL